MGSRFLNPHAATAFSKDPTTKDQARMVNEAHLAFIRKLPSLISGKRGCEACHVRYGDATFRKRKTPIGRKPDDAWTVPMLPAEHRAQHAKNEKRFWDDVGIDPVQVAHMLYAISGDIEEGEKIIRMARRKQL